MHSILTPLILLFFAVLAGPTIASDGVLEINQTCAVETGCFAGDAAGFPVTIDVSGSYLLTGPLMVANAGTHGIELTTDGISLNLNGFEVVGPVTCTGLGAAVSCSPAGSGTGIRAIAGGNRVTVENGRVRGFAAEGVFLGTRAQVRDVAVEANGGSGIRVGSRSVVTGSTAHQNEGDWGILANGYGVVIEGNVMSSNNLDGLFVNGGATILGNAVYDNGRDGIVSAAGILVRNNSVYGNDRDGIVPGFGSLVSDNAITFNGGNGIQADHDSLIQRNVVNQNGAPGLNLLAADVAYRENASNDNTGAAVTGGLDAGDNVCDGSLTCP